LAAKGGEWERWGRKPGINAWTRCDGVAAFRGAKVQIDATFDASGADAQLPWS